MARELRTDGLSINQIYKQLNVAKSSVSLWVRDINLSVDQKRQLSDRGIKKELIEQRRSSRLRQENARRQMIIDLARAEVSKISMRELWLIGIALYWAEGGKTQRSLVRFANGDPKVIEVMMVFFRKICKVPEQKFRGYIHIHPHLDSRQAEEYWSAVSGIPLKQFFKTYTKPNSGSHNKKDTLPYGTFDIYICNTALFLKIKGWIEGISSSV